MIVFGLCLILLPAFAATAIAEVAVADVAVESVAVADAAVAEVAAEESAEAKMVSGMSIVGNDEAPKALYIVPWKSSEIGVETSLHMMLTESALPVDREVFMRQLDFYAVSTAEPGRAE
jgi:hypothetical protein